VIHVRVRDYHVAHDAALFVVQADGDAACVNGHNPVNQKTAQPLLRRCVPVGVKGARKEFDLHVGVLFEVMSDK
jgi:hypothetical protein